MVLVCIGQATVSDTPRPWVTAAFGWASATLLADGEAARRRGKTHA